MSTARRIEKRLALSSNERKLTTPCKDHETPAPASSRGFRFWKRIKTFPPASKPTLGDPRFQAAVPALANSPRSTGAGWTSPILKDRRGCADSDAAEAGARMLTFQHVAAARMAMLLAPLGMRLTWWGRVYTACR